MSKKEISIGEFERLLPLVADKDTSADPNGWTKENPTWGHCAVASVVANKLFGGEILRASLEHVPEFARMRSHYVNSFQDKGIVDFTKPQFGENYPADLKFESRTRDYLIGKNASPQTRQRYKTLSFRLAKVVYENNPLFDDPIYKLCLDNAFESPCQKMGFGSIIVKDSEVIYKGDNDQAIEQLKEFCEPKCIRLDIQSRTDSTIGACSHSEELAIWDVAKRNISLKDCDLYVAGVYANGMPYIKELPDFTCLRCSPQIYNSGVRTVYMPVNDKWIGVDAKTAVKTSIDYALGRKKA